MARFALLTAAAALALSQAAPAQANGGFILVNTNSKVAIQKVYFAHTGEPGDPWKAGDMEGPIAPGTDSTFVLNGSNCWFDIRVEFSDGYTQAFANVNVCQGRRLIAT